LAGLQLAEETSNDDLTASILNNLGENYQSSGLYSKAEPCYLDALNHFRKTNGLSGQAYALSNLGTLAFARGDYGDALTYLDQANQLSLNPDTFGGPHALMGTILNALGLVHQFLGRTEDAERLYLEAIAARRAVNDLSGEIVTLNNMAAMFSERNAPEAAARNYQLALELSERSNDPSHLAQLHNNLGLVAVDLGDKEEARVHYEKALELYRARGMKDGEAVTLDNLGHLAAEPRQAVSLHQQAVEILEKVGNRQSLATALLSLGQAQARMGRREAAISTLTRSVDLLDEMALALSPNDKSAFLGKNAGAYQTLVRLLVEEKRDEEAFQINERARARALMELLGGRNVPVRKAPAELVQREEALKSRIRALLSAPATEANRTNLSSLKEEYGVLLSEIARLDPGSAALRQNSVPGAAELSEYLGPTRALLEYVVQSDRAYLFVVTAEELTAFELDTDGSEILRLLTKWRRSFPRGGDEELARTLGRLLVEPAMAKLEGIEELVVVPHQNLHYMPFSAVQLADKPLIEKYRVTRAPSASAWLVSRQQELRGGPFAAAALGNVALGAEHGGKTARGAIFSPLPGTLEEVNAVVELFPDSTQLIEEQLTSAKFRKVGTESGTLHVATHGVFDSEYPLFSGLVTSDGMVTVADILEWDHTPDLVVLSACETALGDLGKGDDIIGLSSAFQAGGTRCLVATLWPVSDESTSLWMTAFYDALKDNQTTAEASAGATLALRERYPSPYHWAPFVVIGDGETRVQF
jgi:CHAT domain-containing protein/Flp pilus assembly protein TadD